MRCKRPVMSIFTDASIAKTIYGETIGCAGAICEENNNICKFELQRDSTNNISELTAISLAIDIAIEYKNEYHAFDIYADSQWAIFGLTKWNRSWLDSICNNILISSSGQPVKNQHLFLSIMKKIVDNNLKINFYHVKGHVNPNDIDSVENAITVFGNSNKVLVFNKNRIVEVAIMNNMVDNKTRQLLKGVKNQPRVYLTRGFMNPILDKKDLITYYNLVTLGGNPI